MLAAKIAAGILLMLVSCHTASCQQPVSTGAPFAPSVGGWLGVTVDYTTQNLEQYVISANIAPVAFNVFCTLPLDANSTMILNTALPQLAQMKALVLLTVEPADGLSAVTYAAIGVLAGYIKQAQLGGANFLVSFGHEMNGNWYVWGQQPAAYVDAFQKVGRALNAATCGVAMVWAPNPAKGYPWRSATGTSAYGAAPGTPEYWQMDTNGDGEVNGNDDPLIPYYPGDDNVSWVGMAAYSWGGGVAPFLNNVEPAPQQFTTMVTGYGGALSNLYARYSADGVHNKPMVITETSALFIPALANPTGATELAIKQAWWTQVFNAGADTTQALSVAAHFPNIKMIMWFDEQKVEKAAAGNTVDWRFSGNPEIDGAFVQYVSSQTTSTGTRYWGDLTAFQQSGLASTYSTCTP